MRGRDRQQLIVGTAFAFVTAHPAPLCGRKISYLLGILHPWRHRAATGAMILLRISPNPVLTWNAASAVLMSDPSGNRKPSPIHADGGTWF